jgi:hypothetical protein
LKTKVSFADFGGIYHNYSTKNGNLKINTNELRKIKDLDYRISKLDFVLVKELNKVNKTE